MRGHVDPKTRGEERPSVPGGRGRERERESVRARARASELALAPLIFFFMHIDYITLL